MHAVFWANLQLARAAIEQRLREVQGAKVTVVERPADAFAAILEADGLVAFDAPLPQARAALDAMMKGRCRWLHFLSAGREGFEAAGIPSAIRVTHAAGAAAPAVAEHAMALLLALGRRVPESIAAFQRGAWDRSMAPKSLSLEGRTVVIVGLGFVGREVARRARAFGARIVAVTRRQTQDESVDEVHPLSELKSALSRADAVVVSIALTDQTRHLIDAEALAASRPHMLLVNVARGGIVDQGALLVALRNGVIGGAGLDVTDPEPPPPGDPLWTAPNLILSAHFAGAGSPATVERLASGAAANLRRLVSGEALHHLVRPEDRSGTIV